MNCQNCNTPIDYRFLTNCAHCEAKQASLLPEVLIQAPIESEKHATWTRRFVNFLYLMVSSGAGMFSGAVVVYFCAAFTYRLFLSNTVDPGHGCGGRGAAIVVLSMFTGAFLGTIGGSVFAVKNPLCKN
jgi:hypothetical protein